jgi:hypothetical protein
MRKAAILALTAAVAMSAIAPSVFAAEHGAAKAEHGEAKKEGEAQKGKPGTNVDMPLLMAPLTNEDGKLHGYAYISSRLTASSEGAVTDVREKIPFIQDAMVRDINNAGVTTADDREKVDIPSVESRLLANARKVMGANKVKQITICTVQIAELRPKQTPALHTPADQMVPHGETPKNPITSRCES